MELKILDTTNQSLLKELQDSFKWADVALLAVAYASYNAFNFLQDDIKNFLRNSGQIRSLFDIDRFITEKKLIEEFATIPGDSECRIYSNFQKKGGQHLHSKIYLFFDHEKFNLIVGSSNFTRGGLESNIECNLMVSDYINNQIFNSSMDFFIKLWNHDCSYDVIANAELINLYENIYSRTPRLEERNKKAYEEIEKLLKKQKIELKGVNNPKYLSSLAYLFGLISANSYAPTNNEIDIRLERQTVHVNEEFEGYYYYPDISDFKISQYEAHLRDVENIKDKILELFRMANTKDSIIISNISKLNFNLKIKFHKDSKLYDFIINQDLKNETSTRGYNKIIPMIPEFVIKSKNLDIISSFLRGYCDLRGRVSPADGIYKTDKVQNKTIYSSLRIGISISRKYSKFAKQLNKLFEKIGINQGISLSDPKVRNKELLLRIDVRYFPENLLMSHWKKILLRDYINFISNN